MLCQDLLYAVQISFVAAAGVIGAAFTARTGVLDLSLVVATSMMLDHILNVRLLLRVEASIEGLVSRTNFRQGVSRFLQHVLHRRQARVNVLGWHLQATALSFCAQIIDNADYWGERLLLLVL